MTAVRCLNCSQVPHWLQMLFLMWLGSFLEHMWGLLKDGGMNICGRRMRGWEKRKMKESASIMWHTAMRYISCLSFWVNLYSTSYPIPILGFFFMVASPRCGFSAQSKFSLSNSAFVGIDWNFLCPNTGYTRGYGGLQNEEGSLWWSNERVS
jgi:hypothetical protein